MAHEAFHNVPIRISVIGGNRCTPEEEQWAEAVGREIAQHGAILVCGGLGGVMEAASRGARKAGGITVGILPSTDPSSANAWIQIPIATGIGYARNAIVARSSDGVIAIGGALGTLSEIAFALQAGVPVVSLGSWRLDDPRVPPDVTIRRAESPAEALATVLNLVRRA